ncbi:MAG: leucine-rich repeat domain-containing protein [Candidatus Saccharimonadales bacterium]
MKLTKFVQITCSVVALLTVASFTAPKASAATPPDSCFAFNVGTGTITDYYDNEANNIANPACTRDVDIPSTIGGTSVTGIDFQAFAFNQLTTVTIPDGMVNVGYQAFYSNQLTSVTIPSSVTNIEYEAFAVNQLTSVTIPETVLSIGDGAFRSNQLTSVTIPNSVTSIGAAAFLNNQLTSVTIPNGVTSIDSQAFANNQLTNVTIPNGVTSIGYQAFSQNQLTGVIIPANVTIIDDHAFAYNRLTSVTIPNSVTSIGTAAFAYQSQWGGRNDAPSVNSSDPAEVQQALDSFWYVVLVLVNTNNPYNFQDTTSFECTEWDDSYTTCLAPANVGGYLVNSASAEVQYISNSNATLRTSQRFTGLLGGNHLTNYFVAQGPTVPMPADTYNPSPAEQQAIDDALSAYYRIGDEVTITPPAISGYITPPTQTFVLGAATNSYEYIYTQGAHPTASNTSTLVNTGTRLCISSIVGGSLIGLAYVVLGKFKRVYRIQG